MRHRAAALLLSVLAIAAATLLLPAPARAAVEGVEVTITEVPREFKAGADARTVQVVVSTDNPGRCQKVRWSMVLRVDGVELDQVKVDRIEEGSFPLRVQADGDTARLTDVRLDPGSLCRGKTVTARYEVAFDDDADEGRVTFQAQAFDAGARLLQEASATSRVAGERAEPSPSPSASPSESPEPEESDVAVDDEESADAAPPAAGGDTDVQADLAATEGGVRSLLGPGLVIGALLVFAGVGLLLRLRMRGRDAEPQQVPTGFYPTR